MAMNPDPNLSADLSSPDQMKESATSLDPASQEMTDIDDKLMNDFRDLLNRYRDELSTDITEMARGLKISRPLLSDFMNKTDGRNDLPLTPGKIYHLHATLTQTEKLGKKRRTNKSGKPIDLDKPIDEVRIESQGAREKFKRDGLDEMLMTAGYLPTGLKMVPVDPQQHSQLSFISFLYQDRPLNPDLFSQVVQQEIDRTELESRNPDSSKILTDKILIDRLNNTHWLGKKDRESVEIKYKKAIKIAKKDRNRTERIALFKSILYNELSEAEGIPLKLRVTRIEYISLSLAWPKEDSNKFSQLLSKIENIAIDSERVLGTFDEEEITTDSQNEKKRSIYPVLRTIVTCEYNQQEIKLEYISRGTHIAAAIHAAAVNMGFHKYISTINVDVKWLGENTKSLISAIVKIGSSRKTLVSGEWVSADLLHTIIQATIIAGKKWIYQEFKHRLDVDAYEEIIRKTAKIRIEFYENRLVFDRYDFENKKDSIDEFKRINNLAKEWIDKLNQYPKEIQNKFSSNFSSNFYRIYVLSKLYMLHHYSVQVNHKECCRLIGEIDAEFYGDIIENDKVSVSAKIGFAVEKIAYNISFGTPYRGSKPPEDTIDILLVDDLLDREKCILSHLEKIDSKIKMDLKKFINKTKYFSDPGYDIHYSLGSYYLTTSRLLFYRGKTKEEFESGFNRSLQAAYYFQRIGLSRKVQRSIILAGRISLRFPTEDNREQSKQCESLSETLIKQSIVDLDLPPDDIELSLSLKSRSNLLKGEYEKATTENKQEIFICYLRSLRGSLWLGLNRHLADVLYIISKHIKELNRFELDNGIKEVFPELFPEDSTGEAKKSPTKFTPNQIIAFTRIFTRNAGENQSAGNTVRQLLDMYDPLIEPKISEIAGKLKDLSCGIWNSWHRDATGDKNSSHPFVDEIRDDIFLDKI